MAFHYLAFYADCEHEIKPVTQGYRLCLIYNLCQHTKPGTLIPKTNEKLINDIINILTRWENLQETKTLDLLVYEFEHQYSSAGLSFEGLKNKDRTVTTLLIKATTKIKVQLYIYIYF